MTTKHKSEGTAAKAVETTNGNNGNRVVTSKKSNFGHYGYTVTCELTQTKVEDILSEGVLHIAQRAPASRVEKILAGYSKRSDMPAPEGKDMWTRDDIEFTEEKARQFEVELAREVAKEIGDNVKVSVTAEYYGGDGGRTIAYAEAKKLGKAAVEMGGDALQRLAKNVNYTGENLALDNVEFLQAIDTASKATLKARLFA